MSTCSVSTRTIAGSSTRCVPGECRQQQLFLSSEVARPLPLVEVEKDLACLDRGLPPGALELERREQPLMVLVR